MDDPEHARLRRMVTVPSLVICQLLGGYLYQLLEKKLEAPEDDLLSELVSFARNEEFSLIEAVQIRETATTRSWPPPPTPTSWTSPGTRRAKLRFKNDV